MKKPSKKIIILFLVALSIVLLAVFNKWGKTEVKQNLVTPEILTADTTPSEYVNPLAYTSVLDIDKDELPDWQEALRGTDPNNPDTDNDGTRDGIEINDGRDPLVAGPDDILDPADIKKTDENIIEDDTPKTISEAVARNLFASTVYLSDNDNVTEESTDALITDMLKDVEGSFTFKQYDASKLQYLAPSDKNAILAYATEFANTQRAMLLEMQNKINIETDSSKIISDIYMRQADKMYNMKIPKGVALEHLNIVNNFSKASSAFDAISKQKEDPLKTVFALRAYQDIADSQDDSMVRIGAFLRASDIINLMNEETLYYWVLFLEEKK